MMMERFLKCMNVVIEYLAVGDNCNDIFHFQREERECLLLLVAERSLLRPSGPFNYYHSALDYGQCQFGVRSLKITLKAIDRPLRDRAFMSTLS